MEPFDRLVHAADPALVVVTAAAGERRAGCLVSFHGQTSIRPLRYAVWLSLPHHTYDVARDAGAVAVHFLAADQEPLARHFGTPSAGVDKLAGLELTEGPLGAPVLAACPRHLVLRRVALSHDGGDHACLTGDVELASCPEAFEPLRFGDLGEWAG